MDANLDSALKLVLARIDSLEKEAADLREQLKELRDEVHETWMGGTD